MISPQPLDERRRSSELGRADAPARASAAPTCAPSSPPTAPARRAWRSWPRGSARRGCARHRRGARLLPSGARAPAWPRSPTACASAEDVLEAPDGDLSLRLRAERARASGCCSTSPAAPTQHEGNLNCPLAVTRSACLFAVRVLTDPDIPPTAGAYRPIEVRAPRGSVLNARPGAAVAAGNVETSSRVADMVLSAFGRAQGQGTMNNLTPRRPRASPTTRRSAAARARAPTRDGPSAVHVAMSNTLNTPIEALEREFPLRVIEYALRRGSGGAGAAPRRRRRRARARGAARDDLLADRRAPPPRAARRAQGGGDGLPGRDLLDGEPLPGKATGTLRPGQRLRIETPGGGGFGDEPTAELSGSASSASGSWARGWPPTWPARATSWPSGRTPRARPSAWAAEHGARAVRDARRGGRAAATSWSAWSSTASRSPSVLLGEGGAIEAARAGPAVRRHVDDRPARHAPHRRGARRARGARCSTRPSRAPRRAPRTAR